MNPVLHAIDRSAAAFNGLPIWKGQSQVWGQCMISPTFERWLYQRIHRLGFMGRVERRFLGAYFRPGMRDLGFRIFDPVTGSQLDDAAIAHLAASLDRSGYANLGAARSPIGSGPSTP